MELVYPTVHLMENIQFFMNFVIILKDGYGKLTIVVEQKNAMISNWSR